MTLQVVQEGKRNGKKKTLIINYLPTSLRDYLSCKKSILRITGGEASNFKYLVNSINNENFIATKLYIRHKKIYKNKIFFLRKKHLSKFQEKSKYSIEKCF